MGKLDNFCATMFGSISVRYRDGIVDTVVTHVHANVIHRQTGPYISCTVSGGCTNHVFQLVK